jgi:hypothetical protein
MSLVDTKILEHLAIAISRVEMNEVASSSEMLGNTTWRHNPKDIILTINTVRTLKLL